MRPTNNIINDSHNAVESMNVAITYTPAEPFPLFFVTLFWWKSEEATSFMTVMAFTLGSKAIYHVEHC